MPYSPRQKPKSLRGPSKLLSKSLKGSNCCKTVSPPVGQKNIKGTEFIRCRKLGVTMRVSKKSSKSLKGNNCCKTVSPPVGQKNIKGTEFIYCGKLGVTMRIRIRKPRISRRIIKK
jgi:hypothetical protein